MTTSSKPRVLVTDNINEKAVTILEKHCEVIYKKKLSADELKEAIKDMNALMVRSASQVTQEILDSAKELKIIGRAGVGTDNIDLKASTASGVIVINSPDGNTVAASEHTIGLLMALARHIPQGDKTLKAGEWKRSELVGVEVFAKTLGVIGLGRIGGRVARAALALGMTVMVFDPFLSQEMADDLGVKLVDLETIWQEADFITVHAPKTPETTNLLNKETLAKCKASVRIINCARGGIVNEVDLAEAIASGHVAGAAVDVFSTEPPPADHPLLLLGDKVVTTPHLGASTEEAQVNVALDVANQINQFFKTGAADNAVNMPLLRKEVLDPVRHVMPMAEVLGTLVRQLFTGAVQSVEVLAKGELHDERIEPLTLAVLKGMFSGSREGVNYVNAMGIAEGLGIEVKESTTRVSNSFTNLLQVNVVTAKGAFTVAGTLLSDKIFRIVSINEYAMNLQATPAVLLAPHHDQPGMIAKISTLLAEENVNISALQVARKGLEAGGESLMVFNLDSMPSETVLSAMKTLDGVYDVVPVSL